ncbi:hypothetical protein V6Z11_D06G212800 [Gossypium hirsutum]
MMCLERFTLYHGVCYFLVDGDHYRRRLRGWGFPIDALVR